MIKTNIYALVVTLVVSACSHVHEHNQASAKYPYDPAELAKNSSPVRCPPNVCDIPPKLIYMVAPVYPSQKLKYGKTGYTSIMFDVEPTGEVSNIRVVEETSSHYSRVAIRAVEKWRFSPASLNGKPVKITNLKQDMVYGLQYKR